MLKKITASDTRELRRKVLRPSQRAKDLVYPGDDDDTTFHIGFFEAGALLGVASIYKESTSKVPSSEQMYKLRGMAVEKVLQGQGIGSKIIEECVSIVKNNDGKTIWCNARVNALGFYKKIGFKVSGEEFEIEGIGPHYILYLDIDSI